MVLAAPISHGFKAIQEASPGRIDRAASAGTVGNGKGPTRGGIDSGSMRRVLTSPSLHTLNPSQHQRARDHTDQRVDDQGG